MQEEKPVLTSAQGDSSHELTPEQKSDIEKNKDVAALSYLWIFSVAVLYARRDSPFIQYHARQAMWLFLISIPVWFLPGGNLLEFVVLAGMIIGFINAAQGRSHDILIVGQLAKGTLTLGDLWMKGTHSVKKGISTVERGIFRQKGSGGEAKSPGKDETTLQVKSGIAAKHGANPSKKPVTMSGDLNAKPYEKMHVAVMNEEGGGTPSSDFPKVSLPASPNSPQQVVSKVVTPHAPLDQRSLEIQMKPPTPPQNAFSSSGKEGMGS